MHDSSEDTDELNHSGAPHADALSRKLASKLFVDYIYIYIDWIAYLILHNITNNRPSGYGKGSGSIKRWIEKHMAKDAKRKGRYRQKSNVPPSTKTTWRELETGE